MSEILKQVKNYSPKKIEKKDEKLFESIVDNLDKPRTETFNERITRLHHDYDDGPKLAHYGNKKIITMEKRAELKEKIQRPKKFDNNDPSTYPSNQKKTMNTWEIMMELAKNPKTKDDRIQAKEVRETIYKQWNNPKARKSLGEDELKLIGKHKSQRIYPKVDTMLTVAPPVVRPREPEIPLEERIRIGAERKHQQKLKQFTDKFGSDGVMRIIKDFI